MVPGRYDWGPNASQASLKTRKYTGRNKMAVRTTVVGCWWLHPEMEEDLACHHAAKLSPKESEAVLSRAADKAIPEQPDLGSGEWTGGRYNSGHFILHMSKSFK